MISNLFGSTILSSKPSTRSISNVCAKFSKPHIRTWTALNPIIGYKKSAEIAKKAYAEKRAIIDVAVEMTTIERKELESLLDPKNLIKPYF